jgi:stringent starvation protein B
MAGASEYEIVLGPSVPATKVLAELARQGVEASVLQGGVVLVKAVSVPSLTAVIALLFRESGSGLVLDTSEAKKARIIVGDNLQPGALQILRDDRPRETREGLTVQQVGYLMRTALAAMQA